MNKQMVKKVSGIVLNVVLYIFLAICIFAVIMTVISKKDVDGAAELFGYQFRVVTSDSMGECELTDVSDYDVGSIPVRSLIFVKTMPDDPEEADEWYASLKVGDVLTFRYVYTTQVTITHRITSIIPKDTGGYIIELAGDNKNSEDGQMTQIIDTSIPNNTNYVIGKVTGQAFVLGWLLSILKTPVGIICIIIVPCFIIILLEILKIIGVLGADKKKREQEEKEKKENELEELRRRLAELENQGKNSTPAPAQTDSAETAQPNSEEKEEKAE